MNTASKLGAPTQRTIVVPRPFIAVVLFVRRRYLAVVFRSIPAAPRINLVVVYRLLLAAPLVVRSSGSKQPNLL